MADRLLMVIMLVSAILMAILLVNNIFLYKQKFKDYISLMLIFGIAKCAFETLWTLFDGQDVPIALKYKSTGGYCIAFVFFSIYLNRYLMERFGVRMKRKWILLYYGTPVAVIAFLSITTPWTRLMFRVDDKGVIKPMILFDTLFQIIAYYFVFSPLLVAFYYLTLGKKKRPAGGEIPTSVFVFGAIAPIIYWIQIMILGEGADAYIETSLPISLALVYLVTNLSTHAVLDTRAHIEAVETDLRIASKIQATACFCTPTASQKRTTARMRSTAPNGWKKYLTAPGTNRVKWCLKISLPISAFLPTVPRSLTISRWSCLPSNNK